MMRPRLAPMDRRTAISRWRLVARASNRLAVFAQAIIHRSPTLARRATGRQRDERRAELLTKIRESHAERLEPDVTIERQCPLFRVGDLIGLREQDRAEH